MTTDRIITCAAIEYKGKTDFAIITIRKSEYEAVLARFPTEILAKGERSYSISHVESVDGGMYTVAVVRCIKQGNIAAQAVANDLITDLSPQWILTVGIAGGVPDNDFTLGDVVVSSLVYDLTVTAQNSDGTTEYSLSAGPVSKEVEGEIAALESRGDLVARWTDIECERPPFEADRIPSAGRSEYKKKLAESLHRHFVQRKRMSPTFVVRPVASSNALIKNSDIIQNWLKFALVTSLLSRWEFAGVYEAVRGK